MTLGWESRGYGCWNSLRIHFSFMSYEILGRIEKNTFEAPPTFLKLTKGRVHKVPLRDYQKYIIATSTWLAIDIHMAQKSTHCCDSLSGSFSLSPFNADYNGTYSRLLLTNLFPPFKASTYLRYVHVTAAKAWPKWWPSACRAEVTKKTVRNLKKLIITPANSWTNRLYRFDYTVGLYL